ncbi:TniQ family protein [Nocardia sp. NPDC023852]|uniref:TniQ family protein n=1 Tax=Nocardia sp. NPDC023852 TaxID=3154697 RepID=UPI0033FFDB18
MGNRNWPYTGNSRWPLTVGLRPNRRYTLRKELLSPSDPVALARTTKLSLPEVADLSLITMPDRYPPLRPEFLGKQRELHAILAELWVFVQWTRYCPQCLAGDGSTIQQHHGGPWKRAWRLPVTFCCLTHNRLLEHLCPHCREPASSRTKHKTPHDLLIVNATATDLHPWQCRTLTGNSGYTTRKLISCGGSLRDSGPSNPDLDPESFAELLTTQAQLTDLLTPTGPATTNSFGQPTAAPLFFTDLRLLTELITITWPAARTFTPTNTLAETIDQYAEHRRQETQPHLRKRGRSPGTGRAASSYSPTSVNSPLFP